jgi:hypothetical protein
LKREKECEAVTARMRLICLENLLVNRYIDAEDSFYEYAHKYFDLAIAFSEQLSIWSQYPSHTEEWLSKLSTDLKPFIQHFNTLVEIESKRILSIP